MMNYRKFFLCGLLLSLASGSWVVQANQKHNVEQADPVMEHLLNGHELHIGTWHLSLPIIIYRVKDGWHMFSSKKFIDAEHKPITYRGLVMREEKITSVDGARVYDISITRNVASMLLSMMILLLVFLSMARRYKADKDYIPSGGWMLLTFFVNFIRHRVVKPNIDEEQQQRLTPYLLTLFFFIWLNNFMGLLPGGTNVTGNLTVTFGLACTTFLITNLYSSSYYWKHILQPPGVPSWTFPIIVPIELLGVFTKPFTLMIRLFANMLAGHLVLLNIICLIFALKSILVPLISVPLGVFMLVIKLVVAFFQAYIFVYLFATYLGTATHRPSKKVDMNR